MDKQAAIRRVRIAVSVFFGVLTVALCVLWVRSYWYQDALETANNTRLVQALSDSGFVYLSQIQATGKYGAEFTWGQAYMSHRLPENRRINARSLQLRGGHATSLSVPYCYPTLLVAIVSLSFAFPWSRFHFSLRAMLIATTLVAVVLGLGVWLTR